MALWGNRPATNGELVTRYWPLAREVVKSLFLRWKLPRRIEAEEVQSLLAEPLIRAVARFDPSRGVTPRTYLARRMQWAAVDALRSANVIPRRLWQRMKDAERRLSEETVPDAEFRAELASIRQEVAARHPECLHERVSSLGAGPMTLADLVADGRDEAGAVEAQDLVARLLAGLTEEERRIATALMEAGDPADGARSLGVSRAEYDRRAAALLEKLRETAMEVGTRERL